MSSNEDTMSQFEVEKATVVGLGSFHKTLPHNEFGEVIPSAFALLVQACAGDGSGFRNVPKGVSNIVQPDVLKRETAPLVNPQAGLAADQLTHHPASYSMPPAPKVLLTTAAAEMTELYWMALLRDVPFNQFEGDVGVESAAKEINDRFGVAISDRLDPGRVKVGVDLPGAEGQSLSIKPHNVFRIGLPGEEMGPMLSQFFMRHVPYGTQRIDARQRPYKSGRDFLTDFPKWLLAQNTGRDIDGQDYPHANEHSADFFDPTKRFISTMRDLARFVNKDALHQAYFNAALILLAGGAKLNPGNPYASGGPLAFRETGFGVLGGPHILALVSEVATRALKIVWNQKWQVNLRLRPEAYGGLVHVQTMGINGGTKRNYGLPAWVAQTEAASRVAKAHNGYLLPMAFTPGSPAHPAYGAGHATVAGACVTVLKAFFKTFDTVGGVDQPILFKTLQERDEAYGPSHEIRRYVTGFDGTNWDRFPLAAVDADQLTIEGELNKLAQNVAMGRSMGGVHWRTDNTRSLVLGEAIAAEILADITNDANEHPYFEFRTFTRRADGKPKKVRISQGRIYVDNKLVDTHTSAL